MDIIIIFLKFVYLFLTLGTLWVRSQGSLKVD